MKVTELNKEQLDQLKCMEFKVQFPDEITDDEIIEKCNEIDFVEDDFF